MWKADASHWITAEQKAAEARERAMTSLRAERDRRLAEADRWQRRHDDEVALGIETTLTPVQYAAIPAYKQALRDLPENTTDPADPVWPVNPVA